MQQLKAADVEAWQSISKEETRHLVIPMGFRLQAVIACKIYVLKKSLYL